MEDNQKKVNELLEKLDLLLRRQADFSREIQQLRVEINELKPSKEIEDLVIKKGNPTLEITYHLEEELVPEYTSATPPKKINTPVTPPEEKSKLPKIDIDFEKFIGENLISKIGVLILIIGVAIGAKYSLDNDLISPLTRIIMGYLAGLGLLGFGIKLKKEYDNFSAVLVSGAMAILYFITYFAYSFYGLLPQPIAFGLMVLFTAFTVFAAINYNRQVIALIGLVGAYGVPILLGGNSGNVAVLFSYIALINIGILAVALKKYWKPVYYVAFILTWLVFFSWFAFDYKISQHFSLAFIFLTLFFAIFYGTFLGYKLIQKQQFSKQDIWLVLANSFIFYGTGYALLNEQETGGQLLGLFTLGNALIHFIVSVVIYKKALADKNLFYLISGLVLVFITIAVPVQLDGNWVTLLWAGQAALLFWIGRTKQIPIYEKLSYPLMLLAFFSKLQDWDIAYDYSVFQYGIDYSATSITPLFNRHFLSSLLFIAAFGFINWVNANKNYAAPKIDKKGIIHLMSLAIPAILLITCYLSFWVEIEGYWNQLFQESLLSIPIENKEDSTYHYNYDLLDFKHIWLINYSLLFCALLSFVNIKLWKNKELGLINKGLNIVALLVFLTQGLLSLSELRDSYLSQNLAEYYPIGSFNLGIRYISFAFVATLLFATYKYVRTEFAKKEERFLFDILLHGTILWITSSELIHWLDISESTQSYKLGLSILWGIYALILIVVGIWKNKKHLRIGAIALFALTLIKLFFYDISDLNTIAKTIVFVSLGILLLIISFLYNKYKHLIMEEETVDITKTDENED